MTASFSFIFTAVQNGDNICSLARDLDSVENGIFDDFDQLIGLIRNSEHEQSSNASDEWKTWTNGKSFYNSIYIARTG